MPKCNLSIVKKRKENARGGLCFDLKLLSLLEISLLAHQKAGGRLWRSQILSLATARWLISNRHRRSLKPIPDAPFFLHFSLLPLFSPSSRPAPALNPLSLSRFHFPFSPSLSVSTSCHLGARSLRRRLPSSRKLSDASLSLSVARAHFSLSHLFLKLFTVTLISSRLSLSVRRPSLDRAGLQSPTLLQRDKER